MTRTNTIADPSASRQGTARRALTVATHRRSAEPTPMNDGRGESCIRLDDCRRPNSGDHQDRPYTDRQPIPAQPGAYFVTICTYQRECLFGHVVNGEMHLNEGGEVARRCWEDIPIHFPLVELDAFIINAQPRARRYRHHG